MAKSSGVSKKLLAKKDMNFFAEFTANAAKQARMLGYAVAAGILVVFVVLAFIVAFFTSPFFVSFATAHSNFTFSAYNLSFFLVYSYVLLFSNALTQSKGTCP